VLSLLLDEGCRGTCHRRVLGPGEWASQSCQQSGRQPERCFESTGCSTADWD